MTPDCRVLRIDSPVPTDDWQAIYRSDWLAMPTQSPSWAAAIVASGQYRDASRLYEFADSRRAVLPLFAGRFRAGLLSARRSPPAAWGFGGLIATAPLTAGHVRAVLDDLASLPTIVTQVRPNPLHADLWSVGAPAPWKPLPRMAHVLDLAGGFDEVWTKRFSSGTRHRVRRAERAGLEIECGASERLIAEFHALLRRSFERWARRNGEPAKLARWRGLLRDPQAKFVTIAGSAGAAFRLWMARLHGAPAAAILVLLDQEAHHTRGAMNEELAAPTYANYLLQSLAIREACQAGCRHYHMGESGDSSSLAQFKSHFGATPRAYCEYRFERLPISWIDYQTRKLVKQAIGFRDA